MWLVGVVSRRWEWVESMGVATGCGCKEVYRFPHTTYPYSSCICSFLQQHPYFLFIFFISYYHSLVINNYIANATAFGEQRQVPHTGGFILHNFHESITFVMGSCACTD